VNPLLQPKLGSWKKDWDFTFIGILVSIFIIWRLGTVAAFSEKCWIILLVSLMGVRKYRNDVPWNKFLLVGIPFLGLFYYFNSNGASFWWRIANWMFENNKHVWKWDNFMNSIPLNSGEWARWFHTPGLDKAMGWIYNWGFTLPLWICIFYAFWSRSLKKMLTYVFSGHLMQLPLILPFYNLILLREVWFVKGQPDLLFRHFASDNDRLVYVMNCFPSMHTSISFAIMLLALREKDRIFKTIIVSFTATVIFSTLYLQIHWVLDIFAGLGLGYIAVKLADLLVWFLSNKVIPSKWKQFYSDPAKTAVASVPASL
jgi:membrane-associated phospholipid phosphatase